MPQTQIYGIMQIQDDSISLSKLVSPFISATTGNWDITAGNLDATITGIPDPVNDWDVVNKHYVDSLFASSLSWKEPVRVLADSNIDINNPPSTIDGVALNNGDRIALFNQTTATEDGVYIYNGSGNPLTRADDWAAGEGAANWTFWVQEGTQYADTQWTVINDPGSDVIETDDLQIVQIAGQGTYTFQNALTKTGNIIEWGGQLLHDTTVDTNEHVLNFGTSSNPFIQIDDPNNTLSLAGTIEIKGIATQQTFDAEIEGLRPKNYLTGDLPDLTGRGYGSIVFDTNEDRLKVWVSDVDGSGTDGWAIISTGLDTVEAGNGVINNGGVIELGALTANASEGELTRNTYIHDGANSVIFRIRTNGGNDVYNKLYMNPGNPAGYTLIGTEDVINYNYTDAIFRHDYSRLRAGDDNYETSLTINSGHPSSDKYAMFIDSTDPNFQGAQYGQDFHTNFTARSLVDKGYVDAYDKVTVRARATGNIDITNAPATIDGVTLENGDLVLLDQQTTTSEDGIYVFNGAGSAMTRATYFEAGVDIKGLAIFVTEGTQNGQSQFIVSNTGTAVLGTDDILVKAIGGAAAGLTYQNLLTESGNVVEFGGNLLHDTLASLNGYSLTFSSNSGAFNVDISGGSATNSLHVDDLGATLQSELSDSSKYYVSAFDSGAYFGYADSSETYVGFEFSGSQLVMRDDINHRGIVYADDYHTNWNLRSLIDKGYSDSRNGIIKVRVMSTENIDINNPPNTIDGVALDAGDLIALVGQTTPTEDGIYRFDGELNPLPRAYYYEEGVSIKGYLISVAEGNQHGDTVYMVTNDDNAILGTHDIQVTVVGGAQTSLVFQNAITNTGGTVEWGGTLVKNTTVDGDGNYYVHFDNMTEFSVSDSIGNGFTLSSGNFLRTQFGNTHYDQQANDLSLYYDDGSGSERRIRINDSTILVEDSISTFGMKYAADYSANGTLDDRWIPDWGAVKDLVQNSTNRTYNEIHEITSDTTTITLNNATAGDGKSVSNVTIYVNGVRQTEGSSYDYTITDADAGQITFTYTLIGGKTIVVVDYNYS